jgi:hypothetical protein
MGASRIILGVLYESTIDLITMLSTLPSGGIGAPLLLTAVHLDLSDRDHRDYSAHWYLQNERNHGRRLCAPDGAGRENSSRGVHISRMRLAL